jgi:hypothetical protein
MAITALVFGVLSFVCLPFLGPILAIVFGFIGLSRAKQVGTGRGMSIAGIVLGIVGLLAAIVVTVVLVLAADEVEKTDFKETAEDLAVDSAIEANPGFTAEAECEDPSSTEVGTTFDCTVTFNDGDQLTVSAEIISEDAVKLGPAG